jgi:uncharacterized surface protein with fasciclin (FAS1) repeats
MAGLGCLAQPKEFYMFKHALVSAAAIALIVGVAPAGAIDAKMEKTVTVGGGVMSPSKNIIQNAMNSKDHTTLVSAIKTAGLTKTLEGPGPFTVFAPTNAAFSKLPDGTLDNLLKPGNKGQLTQILTYHVVPGKFTSEQISLKAKEAGGTLRLKTLEGEQIALSQTLMGNWQLTDAKGNTATIATADVLQSNGVIHVVDAVVMPTKGTTATY